MNIYEYFAIAIFTAICALILKKKNPELAILVSIAGVVFVFLLGAKQICELIEKIENIVVFEQTLLSIPLKLLGLTILTNVTSAICEDAGEKGLAVSAKAISKFACVAIAFPLFENLLEQIKVALLL